MDRKCMIMMGGGWLYTARKYLYVKLSCCINCRSTLHLRNDEEEVIHCYQLNYYSYRLFNIISLIKFSLSFIFIMSLSYFSLSDSTLYPSHTRGEMTRNAVRMKILCIFLDIWKFSKCILKNSDCILSTFQIFGPILVAGPNVLLMLKTFEVHSKWRNDQTAFEVYSNCTLTAF